MGWQTWLALIGGILAVIGEFWTNTFYLSSIGGVLAVVGALGLMMNK